MKFGHVYTRGRIVWVKYYASGKPFRESTGLSGKEGESAAKKLLKKRMGETGAGRFIGPQSEKVGFEDLASLLKNDYVVNGRKSLDRALLSTEHLRKRFGHMKALDIPPYVGDYITDRLGTEDEGAKPATVRLELAALKRMFTLAYQHGLIPQRPYIPSIEVRNTRQGFFEEAELRAVLDELPRHLRPVVEFAYLTGWRRSEITGLRWHQVDFQAGVVRLEPGTTKNDEGRTFPFRTYPAFAALLKTQRDYTTAIEHARATIVPWVFHWNGRPVRDFHTTWKDACDEAKLSGRIFHDLRRNLERAGVPRSVAMKLTGHKTEAVYRRYAIVCEADLAAGVRKLAEADLRAGG
jgi:integrase